MSYEKFIEVKSRGVTSAFLLRDAGIKIFPVCLNLRKFQHQDKNYFVQLNISFEILFDIENYFTIGFDFYRYSHHQSNLTVKGMGPRFTIKQDPLYELGNEERYLPPVALIEIIHTEQQMLDYIHESILTYEKEQAIKLWPSYLKQWEIHKKNILKKRKKVDNSDILNYVHWHTLFNLFEAYEQKMLIRAL